MTGCSWFCIVMYGEPSVPMFILYKVVFVTSFGYGLIEL